MTVLAVIALSLCFGFLLFGGMVWLQFHDTRKGSDGMTPEERIREQDRKLNERVSWTKKIWTNDPDTMELRDRQQQEKAEAERRFANGDC